MSYYASISSQISVTVANDVVSCMVPRNGVLSIMVNVFASLGKLQTGLDRQRSIYPNLGVSVSVSVS